MLRNGYLSKIWTWLGRRRGTESQVSRNYLISLVFRLSHCLFHDNLVQSPPEVNLNFIQNAGGLDLSSLFKVLWGGSHVQNAVYLLSIELWQLLLRHVVDEEVVSDLGISVNALTVCLSNSLGENSGILWVEKEIDSSKFAILFSPVPVACK